MAFRDVAKAEITQYTYDALGRLKTVTYSNGATVTYDYDAAGNRTQWTQTPPASVQASLSASPSSIASGSSTTLFWNTEHATSASISPGVGAVTPVSGGSISVAPSTTTTYTLSASGLSGSASSQTTVTVHPKPTGALTANPGSISQGGSTTLSWTSSNATSAVIDNGVGSVTPVAGGSVTVSPSTTTTYTLTVTGPGGQHTSQSTVTVHPKPTSTLTANPGSISQGGSATLSWTSSNATSAVIDNGVGGVAPVGGGSVTVNPSATTTYTLTVTGPGGQHTSQTTVTVLPGPSATLTASPTAIASGGSATLTWASPNATSASIDNGIGSVAPATGGSIAVNPAVTTTYTLTTNGPSGPASSQATVTVYPKPTSTLSATPGTISQGGSATLSWTSSNATSAVIDNGVGGVTPVTGGSVTVSPSSTTTYTLTVTGAGGQHTSQTTVIVLSGFTRTIQVSGSGPVDLRALANAAGYNGAQNADVTFEVGSGVTLIGSAGTPSGGVAIDSGSWPTGSYTITLTLRVKSGGVVRGGGGRGGVGGYHGTSGDAGGSGGDAIFCRLPMSIIIDGGGIVQGGGGGGGGGAGGNNGDPYEPQLGGGGGGGGGAPNGSGGAGGGGAPSGANGNPGSATTGGFGGDASLGSGGGTGALYGAIGNDGFNFFSPLGQAWGGSGGAGGYAVRKNGNAVNVTNNGTTAGGIG